MSSENGKENINRLGRLLLWEHFAIKPVCASSNVPEAQSNLISKCCKKSIPRIGWVTSATAKDHLYDRLSSELMILIVLSPKNFKSEPFTFRREIDVGSSERCPNKLCGSTDTNAPMSIKNLYGCLFGWMEKTA